MNIYHVFRKDRERRDQFGDMTLIAPSLERAAYLVRCKVLQLDASLEFSDEALDEVEGKRSRIIDLSYWQNYSYVQIGVADEHLDEGIITAEFNFG